MCLNVCLLDAGSSDRESSLELIKLDISRTFPHLCIFQQVKLSPLAQHNTHVFIEETAHSASLIQHIVTLVTVKLIHSTLLYQSQSNMEISLFVCVCVLGLFVTFSSLFLCSSSGRAISWRAAQHSGSIHLLPARRWLRKSHTQHTHTHTIHPAVILTHYTASLRKSV